VSQYTKSALEQQLEKTTKMPVGWPWRLLFFSTIILGIVIISYFGIILGYKPYLNSQISALDSKINDLSKTIDSNQQKNLITTYSQLVNIQNLLDSHTNTSKLFDLLEKNTLTQVYYLSLDLSLSEKKLRLDGSAPNYDVLSQQLEVFRKTPEIEKTILSDSKIINDGTIRFSIQLIFKPELVE